MFVASDLRGVRGLLGPLCGPAILALAILLGPGAAANAESGLAPMPGAIPVTVDCIDGAARQQQVPREILYAIGVVEGGKVGEIAHNTNGSYDIGVFQINSHWLGMLAR
ncbi:MAG: hypothetical protein WCJ64_24375, partial [Rhodospirillaceae bacterium]